MTDWRKIDDDEHDDLIKEPSEFNGLLDRVIRKHKQRRFYKEAAPPEKKERRNVFYELLSALKDVDVIPVEKSEQAADEVLEDETGRRRFVVPIGEESQAQLRHKLNVAHHQPVIGLPKSQSGCHR